MKRTRDTVDSSSVVTLVPQGVKILVRFGCVIVIAAANERYSAPYFDQARFSTVGIVLCEGSASLLMLLLMLGLRRAIEDVRCICDAETMR